MDGFRCPPDFSVTPLLAFPTDFQAPFDDQIPIFGSPEHMFSATSTSAVSDSASSIRRNNNNNNNSNNNNNNNNNTSTGGSHDYSSATRAKIASHPLYPKLLQAYIDCHKVGAPSGIENVFEEIGGDNERSAASTCLGDDPELDEFMETYWGVLVKYKSDLARPFNEATVFLNSIETELHNLCNNTSGYTHAPDEAVASLEEDFGSGEIELQEYSQTSEDRELKEKLFSKYSGYISLLKHEFSTKKKKAKLPIEARQSLLDWWNIHYKWPYPTEADKVALSECTGLDQKQINNWFINQRKRHWKPSESMQFDVMESIYGPLFMNN